MVTPLIIWILMPLCTLKQMKLRSGNFSFCSKVICFIMPNHYTHKWNDGHEISWWFMWNSIDFYISLEWWQLCNSAVETVPKKKPDKIKNWLLIKNLQFLSYHHETWSKRLANELVFLTKFYDDSSKIVDFSLIVNFLSFPVFLGPVSMC